MGTKLAPLLGLALVFSAGSAQAADPNVKITLNDDARKFLEGQLGLTTAPLEELIKNQLRALYSLADVNTFLRLSSNAQSMANKGLGADYATAFDYILIGIAVNGTADAGDADLASLTDSALGNFDRAVPVAAGVQLSLLVGLEVTDDLFLYANGLAYPVSTHNFEGSGYNIGAHIQYRLLSGIGTKVLAEWGGVSFTTGLELSQANMKLTDEVEYPVPLSEQIQINSKSTGSVELVQKAMTIPIEVSTSLRLLYFLTIYLGAGADIQLGSASLTLTLDSIMTGRGAPFTGDVDIGTAHLDYTGEADPDKLLFRGFFGLQASIGPIHAFGQLNMSMADLTVGVAGGARFAW